MDPDGSSPSFTTNRWVSNKQMGFQHPQQIDGFPTNNPYGWFMTLLFATSMARNTTDHAKTKCKRFRYVTAKSRNDTRSRHSSVQNPKTYRLISTIGSMMFDSSTLHVSTIPIPLQSGIPNISHQLSNFSQRMFQPDASVHYITS